jgi:hypothetical protein
MFGDNRVILISDAMRATLAKSIGMEKTIGSLTPGARADVLLLNKKYELERIL